MRQISIALLMILVPFGQYSTAQELTLRDFNSPPPSDSFLSALTETRVHPSDYVQIAVANDDCSLGLTDEELLSLVEVAEMWGANATREGERTDPAYDISWQAWLWQQSWESASRVVRLRICEPFIEIVGQAR